MSAFGGLFGVFVILVVTLAQLAGNSKRNKNKGNGGNLNYDANQRKISAPKNQNSKAGWSNMARKKRPSESAVDGIPMEGKISAEDVAPSFEVGEKRDSDVQGFDVK